MKSILCVIINKIQLLIQLLKFNDYTLTEKL